MDDLIKCRKKGCDVKEVQLHHLIPKFMGGTDKDGRKYLCKKHHDIISNMVGSFIFPFVLFELKESCKHTVKKRTLRWLEQ